MICCTDPLLYKAAHTTTHNKLVKLARTFLMDVMKWKINITAGDTKEIKPFNGI